MEQEFRKHSKPLLCPTDFGYIVMLSQWIEVSIEFLPSKNNVVHWFEIPDVSRKGREKREEKKVSFVSVKKVWINNFLSGTKLSEWFKSRKRLSSLSVIHPIPVFTLTSTLFLWDFDAFSRIRAVCWKNIESNGRRHETMFDPWWSLVGRKRRHQYRHRNNLIIHKNTTTHLLLLPFQESFFRFGQSRFNNCSWFSCCLTCFHRFSFHCLFNLSFQLFWLFLLPWVKLKTLHTKFASSINLLLLDTIILFQS